METELRNRKSNKNAQKNERVQLKKATSNKSNEPEKNKLSDIDNRSYNEDGGSCNEFDVDHRTNGSDVKIINAAAGGGGKLNRNDDIDSENGNSEKIIDDNCSENDNDFKVKFEFDLITVLLFLVAFVTRCYKLSQPNNVVFDELHYGKYVSLYMKKTFFFDQHPPLGKQIIAALANFVNYNGNFTFTRIGSEYSDNVPIFWLRFIPALSGSLLAPLAYKLLQQLKLNRWTAALGGFLIIFDNAILTQSRFILMESMLLMFSVLGLLFLLKSQATNISNMNAIYYSILSAACFTCAISVKYAGFYSCCLCGITILKYLWNLIGNGNNSNLYIFYQFLIKWICYTIVPIGMYLLIFYIHLTTLHKAGPHDSVMTSAFQASLDGGLASITKGQPLNVVHGSQITLRHTHGRTCWLHSHAAFYPIRYTDKRGSSHQQQVTCYSFKDVNNWWIVKRPARNDLVVGDELDPIKDGDEIQLVHGITTRALNSHDVAAPMSPQSQEVSCYIDYNVSMPAQNLWRVEIINKDEAGNTWHAITSQIRLIHVTTKYALKFSGRQLADWGFNQHEIVADRIHVQQDTVWNVEEHRYTKTDDEKERERQMLLAEMIPTQKTHLSFWFKFVELQNKMIWYSDPMQSHMYSSTPVEWPFMDKGIAYWVDKSSNAQIHLLGNIVIWYSSTLGLIAYTALLLFYLLRRRRLIYDITDYQWTKFKYYGEILLTGYLIHYLPFYFVERTLFIHSYLPAYVFKIMLLCCLVDHIGMRLRNRKFLKIFYRVAVILWIVAIVAIFKKFAVISYGMAKLKAEDVLDLRWKDTWDFILHKELKLK